MIRSSIVLAATLVCLAAAASAYPGGTPTFQTDAAPYCAGCHSSRDAAALSGAGDRATKETDRALELRTRDRQRKLIAKIDEALRRIDEGTYGYCEETDEPISLRRLEARPIATLSLEAQERHERMERTRRDD